MRIDPAVSFPASARNWWLGVERSALLRLAAMARRRGRTPGIPSHLETGVRGELEAFFFLSRQGYHVVARRWTSIPLRGDLDIVAWHEDTLCFIEVKTRTAHDAYAAEAVVDEEKKSMSRRLARAYLRRCDERVRDRIRVRFDIVAVYLLPSGNEFQHFPGAF